MLLKIPSKFFSGKLAKAIQLFEQIASTNKRNEKIAGIKMFTASHANDLSYAI